MVNVQIPASLERQIVMAIVSTYNHTDIIVAIAVTCALLRRYVQMAVVCFPARMERRIVPITVLTHKQTKRIVVTVVIIVTMAKSVMAEPAKLCAEMVW